MKFSRPCLPLTALLMLVVAGNISRAAESLAGSESLIGLIRSNLTGVTDIELDRALVQGLATGFKGRVVLVATNAPGKAAPPLLAKQTTFDGALGYVRVSRMGGKLPVQLKDAVADLGKAAPLKGLVLDLRFANGLDYTAAGKVAGLFLSDEQALLEWDGNAVKSAANKTPIRLPMVVLVNEQTRGAAEALAAVLRETKTALVIGGKTAGEANVFREFALPDGQKVRIAAGTVKLGSGAAMPPDGVAPDIGVKVAIAEEKAFLADPYRVVKRAGITPATDEIASTNTPRRRINEAELVRMQREGLLDADEELPAAPKPEPAKPIVRDPVLARGLDLLKALAIVKPAAN